MPNMWIYLVLDKQFYMGYNPEKMGISIYGGLEVLRPQALECSIPHFPPFSSTNRT
jgi:hypothetical protein